MNHALWLPGGRRNGFIAATLLAVVLLFVWSAATGEPFGSRSRGNTAFLLASGWLAVACYVALALYAVRRAAHRLRLSPEFRWQVPLTALERAQSALAELQDRALRQQVQGSAAVHREATAILRQFGVQRVLAVRAEPDPRAVGLVRLVVEKRQPLGRLAVWLTVHVWLGIAAALVVFAHGGLRSASWLGLLLNGFSAAVIATGVLGALLWTAGPTWLTRAERELSVEKAFALRGHYDRKVAAAAAALRSASDAERERRQRELATLTGQRDRVAAAWRRLNLLRESMRVWRLVHVPCSIVLLALVAVHVLAVWYY
ncbi:MAG: hypothetical protein JNL08_03815 [Planctomycetes bacterium]|nr:hypothetical protein [Planctomycetota bacterium]